MRRLADSTALKGRDLEEFRRRILTAANDLISDLGFDGTTMGMVAQELGISSKRLTGQYLDKQQILNELVGYHLDVLEGIRAFTRNDPELSPLQSMQREWKLMCEYMNNHQDTIQAFQQNQSNIAPWIGDRIKQLRSQDVELLEKACALKELQRVNSASLEAVLYGTLWSLIFELVQEQGRANFTVIPEMISSRVLAPLVHPGGGPYAPRF
jgi:AcrR family transcriptional regulator